MNKTESQELRSSATHSRTKHSTTMNRKYVKRPAAQTRIKTSAEIQSEALKRRQALAERMNQEKLSMIKHKSAQQAAAKPAKVVAAEIPDRPAEVHPLQKLANTRLAARKTAKITKSTMPEMQPSPKERKDAAIAKAMSSVSTMETKQRKEPRKKHSFSKKRVGLAFACATVAVAASIYFVKLNMPDISVRVAAMQTGVDSAYPAYVPRNYSLTNITSEDNRVVMEFAGPDNVGFTLTEEKSAWDSSTLETNYARKTWGADYTLIKEQGLSIFVSGSNAAWVNGGVLYKITTTNNNLTKKQIRTIATSL